MASLSEITQEEHTTLTALTTVLRICRNHDTLLVGATEVTRGLYRNASFAMIVITEDLLEEYKIIIVSKAREMNIPVINIESRSELAKMMSFKAKKIGAVGVTDFVYESMEKSFVMNSIAQ